VLKKAATSVSASRSARDAPPCRGSTWELPPGQPSPEDRPPRVARWLRRRTIAAGGGAPPTAGQPRHHANRIHPTAPTRRPEQAARGHFREHFAVGAADFHFDAVAAWEHAGGTASGAERLFLLTVTVASRESRGCHPPS
jgi:hypothetical protein